MTEKRHPEHPILMVDDEESWLLSLEALLARHGHVNNFVTCTDSTKVMDLLAERKYSMVLLDYGMPGISGEELLSQIVLLYPQLPVVILTGYDYVNIALRCREMGAVNYFIKTEGELSLALKIMEILWKHIDPQLDSYSLLYPELFSDVIAESPPMRTACQELDRAIDNTHPLLLVGEKGSGKHFLANKLMQQRSGAICQLNADSTEYINFADEDWFNRLISQASNGHILLENVDELHQKNQLHLMKLLRQPLSVRFVMTLSDLKPETTGKLRDDLLQLLKTQMVKVPALRDRKEDIPKLTRALIKQTAESLEKKPPTPPGELDLLLQSYAFPGNVSELKSMVHAAVSAHRSKKMSMDCFKQAIAASDPDTLVPCLQFSEALPTIEEAVSMLIDEAARRADGNQTIMAEMLGITRQALNKRLQRRKEKESS